MKEFLKEYYEKGFGYEYKDGKLIIARIDKIFDETLNNIIDENNKFENFEMEKIRDFYIVKIDINEYKKINIFLNALLKNDIMFIVNKKEKVEFDGIPYAFSEELVELKYIEKYYRYKEEGYR